ncbi:G5 domain-containing protein [Actinoplanes sp. DH11]|uniref:G5 domain-containing protein n=1 Tax=Actinoplanes sp. DH11 TaxID=2857011 RepID=UPI001E2D6FC7|nr:G5 domain-containing protein [Actinoplanes sp. DH11]
MTAGATALLVLAGGGVAGVVTMTGDGEPVASAEQPVDEPDLGAPQLEESPEVVSRAAAAAEPLPKRHTSPQARASRTATGAADKLSKTRVGDDRADRTGAPSARTPDKEPAERATPDRASAEPSAAEPVVTTRTDVETRVIPFDTQVVRDPSLPRGTRMIESPGAFGEETLRYVVTITDGQPTGRRLVGSEVTREPEARVVVFGARRKSDQDCEGLLRICMPLGRAAACPQDGSGDQPGGKPGTKADDRTGDRAGAGEVGDRAAGAKRDGDEVSPRRGVVQAGSSVILTDEELKLLDEETLDRVRLEPTGLC